MQQEMTSEATFSVASQQPTNLRTQAKIEDRQLRQSITIGKPALEIFEFWRNFENLSFFMKDIESVTVISPTQSHWKLHLKNGMTAEWDAVVTEELPGKFISWKSLEGSKISTSGSVMFEEISTEKTVVRLVIQYSIPGGRLTEWVTFFSGEDPETLTLTNLKRLKAYLETGEIPTTQGQPNGRLEH
jgi:uncharacterized membrane protein